MPVFQTETLFVMHNFNLSTVGAIAGCGGASLG
jgi:hypothetical protein